MQAAWIRCQRLKKPVVLLPIHTLLMAVIKMDWQKNLLIAAILATLLMLVIRWNEFQEQLGQQPAADHAELQPGSALGH